MQLRWTEQAAADLERITDYLFAHAPPATAERAIREIYSAPSVLMEFPDLGRSGRKEGTRELILNPLPYIVIYQIAGEVVLVIRILHGAQKWPYQ